MLRELPLPSLWSWEPAVLVSSGERGASWGSLLLPQPGAPPPVGRHLLSGVLPQRPHSLLRPSLPDMLNLHILSPTSIRDCQNLGETQSRRSEKSPLDHIGKFEEPPGPDLQGAVSSAQSGHESADSHHCLGFVRCAGHLPSWASHCVLGPTQGTFQWPVALSP